MDGMQSEINQGKELVLRIFLSDQDDKTNFFKIEAGLVWDFVKK